MLQCIDSISTMHPMGTFVPVGYVIIVGMIIEGITDYKKWSKDRKENNEKYRRVYLREGD